MVHKWDLAMVEKEMACANLRMGSMRDQGSLQNYIVACTSWPPLLALIWGARS
jgi:hypothetical protein